MKKFMKKSEREKYTINLVVYYTFAIMVILLVKANLINTDLIGVFSGYLNFQPLIVSFIVLIPINLIIYILSVTFVLWVLNKTRYFAWPTDKFVHSAIEVSIIVAIFEVLIIGSGFDMNPLSHIYLYNLYPEDWMAYLARTFVVLTFVFLPFFVYSVKTLDYNYFASIPISLEISFLSTIIGISYIGIMGIKEITLDINAGMSDLQVLLNHLALYVAAIVAINLSAKYYDREHQTARKAGTVYIEPEWEKVHVFGYYWRPGQASERSSKLVMGILLAIFLAIIALFFFTGHLNI